MLSDVRIALRTFAKTPAFTLAAVATLALGIGANTAIFTLVNAALLQPLPYPDSDRMVQLWMTFPDGGGVTLSVPEFEMFRRQSAVLQDVTAYDFGGPGVSLGSGGDPELVKAIHVSEAYFRLFGAPLSLGRTFRPSEDSPKGGRVVVLSHAIWKARFQSDPTIAGKMVTLGHEAYEVIGVTGPDFRPEPRAQLWLPLQADLTSKSHASYLRVAARLRDGVTLEQANAVLKGATGQFLQEFSLFNREAVFAGKLLRETTAGKVRNALLILFATVTMVLLIACSNVANLLLARGVARQREMSIRASVGASRARLLRQLLTECLLLSFAGSALGLLAGQVFAEAMLAWNPDVFPAQLTLDWRIFAFTACIALSTAVLFGILPALQATRSDLVSVMKESGTNAGAGLAAVRAKSVLVVLQVAMAVVLLTGAGLMIRTFAALRNVNPGLDPHGILTLDMSLRGTRFHDTISVANLVTQATARLQNIPGVLHAATTWTLPVEIAFGSSIFIEGRPLAGSPVHGAALMRPVSSQYFDVFRIPLTRGRAFTDRDVANANSVAIISESLAKKFWPKGNPLGERITIDKFTGPDFAAPPREIVGIVGDVRDTGIAKETSPLIYIPQGQVPNGMTTIDSRILPITWVIRTAGAPLPFQRAIEKELRIASGGLPVAHVRSMEEVVRHSTLESDFQALSLTAFAATSLLLASIGIYGLLIYTIQQRTRETGIRLALGATPEMIRNAILRHSMLLTAAGIVLGAGGSVALARFLQSSLYGVKPLDPVAIGGAIFTLALTAGLAAWLPARREAQLDPARVLRGE